MDFANSAFWSGMPVFAVQVATGVAKGYAARRAVEKRSAILGQVTVGNTAVSFDKSDILAIALVVFVFWSVNNKLLEAQAALGAFVAVLTGTGAKELIQAILPIRAKEE